VITALERDSRSSAASSIGDPRSTLYSSSTRAGQSCLVTENRSLVRSNGRQTKMLEAIDEANLIEKDV